MASQIQQHLCECGICGLPVTEGINPVTKQPYRFRHNHHRKGKECTQEHKAKLGVAQFGEKGSNWKGGRFPDTAGYILVWSKEHPQADSKGYVREHRLVYEEYHKCCILPMIDVHHIDGNKQNNDINNLMPLSRREHGRIHHKKEVYQ
jgi:hypothetical protein